MERVVKNEEEEEDIDVEDDQAEPEERKVPPPEKVSIEIQIQTDDSFLSDQKSGSSAKEEAPAPSGNSQKGEEPEEKKDDIQKVDTAPKKRTCHTCLSWSRYHWIWWWFNFSRTFQKFYRQLPWWMVRILQSRLPSFKLASTHVQACKTQGDQWTTQRPLVHRLWQTTDGNLHCQT